ncbi:SEC-C domain-containing protein [Kribbella sp. NPDC051718]|uniref:SEC-C domain-containing protein n=1 Tax=Kribbella sp. NPDC051718 TaxID=3155168 RepID=UPI00343FAF8D
MDESIAEKIRAICATAVSADPAEESLEMARIHADFGEPELAVEIWERLITEGGEDAVQAHLDYADHLFTARRDTDAFSELQAVLSTEQFLSESWMHAIEILEDHKPSAALAMYLLAMESMTAEDFRNPAHASGYLNLAIARRRLKWKLDIPLSDSDLLVESDDAEYQAKLWRLLALVGESQVADRQPRFWDRGAREALAWTRPIGALPEEPNAYYLEIEAVLRARGGGRVLVNGMSLADWTRLRELADDARTLDDLQTIVDEYDGGTTVEWPPARNQRCWCGSGRKYKNCCGGPHATAGFE